jgi:hypothetical protein
MKLLRNKEEVKSWFFLHKVNENFYGFQPYHYPCFAHINEINGSPEYLYRSDLERMLEEMK